MLQVMECSLMNMNGCFTTIVKPRFVWFLMDTADFGIVLLVILIKVIVKFSTEVTKQVADLVSNVLQWTRQVNAYLLPGHTERRPNQTMGQQIDISGPSCIVPGRDGPTGHTGRCPWRACSSNCCSICLKINIALPCMFFLCIHIHTHTRTHTPTHTHTHTHTVLLAIF